MANRNGLARDRKGNNTSKRYHTLLYRLESSDMSKEWSDIDKAQWILENGPVPDIAWIFERVGDKVYRRPMTAGINKIPPWIDTRRQEVLQYTADGYDIQDLNIQEHTRS